MRYCNCGGEPDNFGVYCLVCHRLKKLHAWLGRAVKYLEQEKEK